jgi:putative ABC transport system permease protein
MRIPLKYGLRNLWLRRATTLATAAGIALVVFVLAASFMLSSGLRSTLLRAGSLDRVIVMQRDSYSESNSRFRQAVAGLVAAAPGIRTGADGMPVVSPESVLHLPLARTDDRSKVVSVQIRGVTPKAFSLRPEVRLIQGRMPQPATDEAIVGSAVVGKYAGLGMGGAFELHQGRSIAIVGVFEADSSAYESEVWVDLDCMQTSLDWQGTVSSVTAQLTSPIAFDAFGAALALDTEEGIIAERERDYYERVSDSLSSVILAIGGLVTAIFVIGAAIGAAITMYGMVSQRSKEIGVLRALGFSQGDILLSFALESFVLGAAGAGAGLMMAMLTTFLEISTMNASTGAELTFRFTVDARALASAVLTGTFVGGIGGFFPALRAARVSPVLAMRA